MKKVYINPTMNVHTIKVHHHILDGSPTLNMGIDSSSSAATDDAVGSKDDWEDDEYSW